MTTKEWLSRGFRLNGLISAMEDDKKATYERCISCTAQVTGMPHGGMGRSTFDAYVAYAVQLNKAVDELLQVKNEIFAVVNSVQDDKLREVLVRRYLNFKKFEEIAVELHLRYVQTQRKDDVK